jgi:hypothetical protein
MNKVAKKPRHDGGKVKVSGRQELIMDVLGQIVDVSINLNKTKEAAEPWVGLLECAALGLSETKDWTSRIDSDAPGRRPEMAEGSAKVEEVP